MSTLENYLDKVKGFYAKSKRLPSYSEMLILFGFSSKNAVYRIVHKWVDEGILQKENNKLSPTSRFFALPFYGIIKAGYPIIAEENKSYLTLDEYLIEDPQSSFLLKVSGDSLVDAGIYEGDIVIIDSKREAYTGDIVLAQIDREWTLKILRKTQGLTYLEAANPKYPLFKPRQTLEIRGVVKGVVRKFN
ncbi:LexA family transcriptional regulator [Candidatus Roizmanbacteria bacterium]|nr:LexA family transcriptional regulator [Candidatus Roizmanbacteria bacterium]